MGANHSNPDYINKFCQENTSDTTKCIDAVNQLRDTCSGCEENYTRADCMKARPFLADASGKISCIQYHAYLNAHKGK